MNYQNREKEIQEVQPKVYYECQNPFYFSFLAFNYNFIHIEVILNLHNISLIGNKIKNEVTQKMNNDDIFTWIVNHPNNYPGKHSQSQPRTFEAVKPLQPKAQFHIVIKALGEYIKENMQAGKGINFRGFGAFAFEVDTNLVKPAQLSNFDITKDLPGQREQRMHNHKVRPCFVPDTRLQGQLTRYPGKQQIDKPKSQHSIYQKGFSMIYCNPVPVAHACYLDKDVTESALNAFAKGVIDLVALGKNMEIKIGVITIKINNRNLTYSYDSGFANNLNTTEYEKQMKKSITKTKDHWGQSYDQKWGNSNLSGLITKPNPTQVGQYYEKGLALKIMSLDLNTTQEANKNKNRFA